MPNAINRVLSGMRPTGRLHIGHYFGALQNWVRLQNDPAYDCFFFVADWHALTSDYADTSAVAENTVQIVIDYLAAGLDPAKSVIFAQSFVPEHAELHLLLSMVTPLGWLERIPTYKEALDNITNKDLHTYGFLGYPTLQTADIVMYSDPGTPLFVPVGEDQVSHVEFSREVVRRFNLYYGFSIDPALYAKENRKNARGALLKALGITSNEPLLPESAEITPEQIAVATGFLRQRILDIGVANFFEKVPQHLHKFFAFSSVLEEPAALLTQTPRIPGLDGRKMSKSYNNAISLSESDADIRSKTKVMVTDPARKRRTDPGNPDVCPVFDWHKLFSTPERDPGRLDWVRQGCTTAGIGCIECKSAMADNLIKWIEPVRARRLDYEQNPKKALQILDEGSAKAREHAKLTMERVRDSVFHWPSKRASFVR
ncbi:MAG TPA: tryptophan--tRNA ligase [Methylomirabilota bacterium]|nr:tryptophan--tRNA ligase [Methylomirabilota bacterium]